MHKIFCSFVSLFTVIALGFLTKTPVFYDAEGQVTYYCNKKNSNCTIVTVDSDYVETYRKLKNVKGECVENADEDYVKNTLARLNAKKRFSEKTDGVICDYYYSPLIKDSVIVNGKRVNIHVARRFDTFTMATPMIFGSF